MISLSVDYYILAVYVKNLILMMICMHHILSFIYAYIHYLVYFCNIFLIWLGSQLI